MAKFDLRRAYRRLLVHVEDRNFWECVGETNFMLSYARQPSRDFVTVTSCRPPEDFANGANRICIWRQHSRSVQRCEEQIEKSGM